MSNDHKHNMKIDKSNETRTKEISKMIGEGGLGAEKYYDIKKAHPTKEQYDAPNKPTE